MGVGGSIDEIAESIGDQLPDVFGVGDDMGNNQEQEEDYINGDDWKNEPLFKFGASEAEKILVSLAVIEGVGEEF